MQIEIVESLLDVTKPKWNSWIPNDYPFLQHEFLVGLESSGCTTADSGWQPFHITVCNEGDLVGFMPCYLKTHSYGEYVFDWSWADAWQRSGLSYYPKLLSGIPFTPATGPRLLVAEGIDSREVWIFIVDWIKDFCASKKISSWHILFPSANDSDLLTELDCHQRTAIQFHWFNQDYRDFQDYLSCFVSRKRKNIKKERSRVKEQAIEMEMVTGSEILPEYWSAFYDFYQMTYAKRSGHGGYLSRDFFLSVLPKMGDQVVMSVAKITSQPVAAALYFKSSNTLFGRYWGCTAEYDFLHFEACYYQGIEYCITHGLSKFDPGAQGEHKIQRGFKPTKTYSNHFIESREFSNAVKDFTEKEADHVERYRLQANELLPFHKTS